VRPGASEFGGEGFDLASGFFEGAGAVNFFSSVAEFFFDGKLRGNAAAGLGFAEAAREEPLELLLGLAPGDDEAVQPFINTGFDEESGFDECGVADPVALPFVELA
jgi:hypothetical protein